MALLCCCYGHLLFSGLASLGYTGGGDVYVNDSGACGRRTDFVIEYLVCSGILYAALQSFYLLIPGSSCHFWLYFHFVYLSCHFPVLAGASPCTSLYLGDSGSFAGGTVRDSSRGYL